MARLIPPRKWCCTFLAAILALGGCKTTDDKKPEIETPAGTMRDQSGDTSFQAFVSRLRKAAARRDIEMLAHMMTVDFGFSWAPDGEGARVFTYWDQHRLWPELNLILSQQFVHQGDYMVAPPEVATDPDYGGYRAGLKLVDGSWRFAYFVSAPPPEDP